MFFCFFTIIKQIDIFLFFYFSRDMLSTNDKLSLNVNMLGRCFMKSRVGLPYRCTWSRWRPSFSIYFILLVYDMFFCFFTIIKQIDIFLFFYFSRDMLWSSGHAWSRWRPSFSIYFILLVYCGF
jgi:hypothetical protein